MKVPGYALKRELASGASGTVYEAVQESLDRKVALKVLSPGLFDAAETRARFLREAKLQGNLIHPNIVAVYDAGFVDSRPYMAVELVTGGSLRDHLESLGKIEIGEAIRIAADIAEGVGYSHATDVVHRDLKPENVLLTRDGEVKVADFGLAKSRAQGKTLQTAQGVMLGTPGYMAPEVIRGEPAGPAADCYALGVILFEMLAGRRPFGAADISGVLRAQLEGNAPSLGEARPDVPAALEELYHRCLDLEPARRPASMTRLASALRRLEPLESPASGSGPVATVAGRVPVLSSSHPETPNPFGPSPSRASVGGAEAPLLSLPKGRGERVSGRKLSTGTRAVPRDSRGDPARPNRTGSSDNRAATHVSSSGNRAATEVSFSGNRPGNRRSRPTMKSGQRPVTSSLSTAPEARAGTKTWTIRGRWVAFALLLIASFSAILWIAFMESDREPATVLAPSSPPATRAPAPPAIPPPRVVQITVGPTSANFWLDRPAEEPLQLSLASGGVSQPIAPGQIHRLVRSLAPGTTYQATLTSSGGSIPLTFTTQAQLEGRPASFLHTGSGDYSDLLAVSSGREMHLFWREEIEGNNRILYHHVTRDGGRTWSPRRTVSQPGLRVANPSVVAIEGGVLVAWSYLESGIYRGQLRKITFDPENWSEPVEVPSLGPGPVLARAGDGPIDMVTAALDASSILWQPVPAARIQPGVAVPGYEYRTNRREWLLTRTPLGLVSLVDRGSTGRQDNRVYTVLSPEPASGQWEEPVDVADVEDAASSVRLASLGERVLVVASSLPGVVARTSEDGGRTYGPRRVIMSRSNYTRAPALTTGNNKFYVACVSQFLTLNTDPTTLLVWHSPNGVDWTQLGKVSLILAGVSDMQLLVRGDSLFAFLADEVLGIVVVRGVAE